MWNKLYWAQVAERAVKSFAQALLALLGGEQAGWVNVTGDWWTMAKAAGLAALVSVLMSLLSTPIGPGGTPSLVPSPADAGLDKLAAATRGLVNAAARVTTHTGSATRSAGPTDVLEERTERAADVLVDLGKAKP